MADATAIIHLLAAQSGPNAPLRDALLKAALGFLATEQQPGEHAAPVLDYLATLAQLEQQQIQSEKRGQPSLRAALHKLAGQIRADLHQAALTLHQTLAAGHTPDARLVRQVGVDIRHIPLGLPGEVNLLHTSQRYAAAVNDRAFLEAQFPGQVPRLIAQLTAEQQQTAAQLREIALNALKRAGLQDHRLAAFHEVCQDVLHSRHAAAENELAAILAAADSPASRDHIQQLDAWLQTFGASALTIFNTLAPKQRQLALQLLLRSRVPAGLEAVIVMDPPRKGEQDLFATLMLVRFGAAFHESAANWQAWLEEQLAETTQRQQATAFWRAHPYYLPDLLAASLQLPEIPPPLRNAQIETLERVELRELLDRRTAMLSDAERDLLEQAQPPAADNLDFRFEDIYDDNESVAPDIIEGAVETAIDFTATGDLLESTVVTLVDRSAELGDHRLTVTIEDDEAGQPADTAPASGVWFSSARERPPVETEPQPSIWRDHIFPFVAQNLVFVIAPTIIFIGLLLLVFSLWDRAPYIRYGLTPFLVVSVSYALARIGLWLKGEDIASETPLAIVQSAAVFLAPLSLLFVALLASDRTLTLGVKLVWGAGLSAALLGAWGYIFTLAIKTVHRAWSGVHSVTLLLLNALLLLLPIAMLQTTFAPFGAGTSAGGLDMGARAIFVLGFYAGFAGLCWSMPKVLGRMGPQRESSRIPILFYSITCLGTFALVWGLTHARLLLLPEAHTYAPLLVLGGFLLSMIEFTLRDSRQQTARITSLSYLGYFFLGLGVLLGLGHDYVRVVTLLLAGLVWFYQALHLKEARHFNLAMVILTGAFSSIALIRDFPPTFFPYLTLLVILGLHVISLTVPLEAVKLLAASLSPIYLSFAFVVSILWQWAWELPPFGYGAAFVLFGLFSIYLGAKSDKLIHVHAGAGYLVAALPYLGTVDMNLYTLEGNTLVFGLALVGILWTMLSSASSNRAIRDSRSTVLWNIGILAFCLLCLRVILNDAFDFSADPLLQFQILSGPVLVGALMLLAGFLTQSYIPVYLGLIILVIIFPDIKNRLEIPMYSGMGSALSGLGFFGIVFGLSRLKRWRQPRRNDLVWRKKAFPLQANNHYLVFANPLMVAAFFLCTRTIFSTYPNNYFRPLFPFSISTPIAVLLCGTAYPVFSVWFRKSVFSYVSVLAIWFGLIHGIFVQFGPDAAVKYLPLALLAALLYCEAVRGISAKLLPRASAGLITLPFSVMATVALWLAALTFGPFYYLVYVPLYGSALWGWWLLPGLYLGGRAGWIAWRSNHLGRSWAVLAPAYLLLWQMVTLIVTAGAGLLTVFDDESPFYLTTALFAFGVAALFFVFEQTIRLRKFRALTPLLWMSLLLLLLFSPLLAMAFYDAPDALPHIRQHLIVWAGVSFVVGRFLSLGLLWLWGAFLLHLLFLPDAGLTRFYVSFHPFTLACIALGLAAFSVLSAKVIRLYQQKYAYPRARLTALAPSFLFALAAHLIVVGVFVQAVQPDYRHVWSTILGMFLAALPALFAAHQLGYSRRLLFGVPYTIACVALLLAVRVHFPHNEWLGHLSTLDLVGCGLFLAVLTAMLSDLADRALRWYRPSAPAFHVLTVLTATSVLALLAVSYLQTRNIQSLSWQWLLTTGLLALGASVYFRYAVPGK